MPTGLPSSEARGRAAAGQVPRLGFAVLGDGHRFTRLREKAKTALAGRFMEVAAWSRDYLFSFLARRRAAATPNKASAVSASEPGSGVLLTVVVPATEYSLT